ncbi:uncharacterized protein yc1106_07202 [Curvularia clavata]|uniref:3'-5' exonuclease domain-containing protein n=1 Tax=Curvularia clavata TaxID=95742 RepID=A0A9Q9DTJ8_CURCL|nr:uncharacterized protein yc1106_07202 [Curvularia clavata]
MVESQPSLQALSTSHAKPSGSGHGHAIDSLQQLWDPSYGLRFATTLPMGTQQPTPAPDDKESMIPSRLGPAELPHTEDDSTGSSDGAGNSTQAHTGDADCTAASQSLCDTDHVQESDSTYMASVSSQGETELDVSEEEEKGEEETNANNSLAYQIPEDTLRAAMVASPRTRASYWSARLYQGPEGESLSIHYCKTFDVAERVAQYFLQEKIVGFDIEWKPHGNPHSIKHNASLIQLACEDRVALFHISLFSGFKVEQLMPPSLRAILESPDIIKVGVAIKGDFKRVEKYLKVHPQGVFELSRLHNLVEWYEVDPSKVSNRLVSLATQVLQHLQLPLYKGEQLEDDADTTSSVRESDWSLPLSLEQTHYAAADAYAGFRLYHTLEWKRTRLTPTPPPVMLCDYDNKPSPRTKQSRKKAEATAKAKDDVDSDMSSSIDPAEEEQDSDEDALDYQTAPEDHMDNHEFEDLVHATACAVGRLEKKKVLEARPAENTESDDDDNNDKNKDPGFENKASSLSRSVGRVDLPWLKGIDPGYPELPQSSQEDAKDVRLNGLSDDSDDEFPDAELEEALGNMTLDNAGNLKEDGEVDAFEQTSPSYDLATTWAQRYVQSTIPSPTSSALPRIHATASHLRTYHLWHHQKMAVEEIALLVRDPPLPPRTVTNYILQAVTLEKLEYEREALRNLMSALPSGMRKGRWKGLAEKVGALD